MRNKPSPLWNDCCIWGELIDAGSLGGPEIGER